MPEPKHRVGAVASAMTALSTAAVATTSARAAYHMTQPAAPAQGS